VNDVVKVACVQAEPVAFDRAATIDKLEGLAAEAAGAGARLALFPETFIPVYPSNRWVRYLAGWGGPEAGAAREVFARLMKQSVTVPGPDSDRLAEIARTNDLWLAVGVNELDGGTIYNSLLVYSPAGGLALHHRKLMPTNHERLVWGLGDVRGLETIATDVG
jgi:nitrilase